MPDSTQDASPRAEKMQDRDPSEGWITEAVRATTLGELRAVASAARKTGDLTPRDQAWCRALAEHLDNVDAVAMRELVGQLGPIAELPVTDGRGR